MGVKYKSVTPAQLQKELDDLRTDIDQDLEVIRDALGVGQFENNVDGGDFLTVFSGPGLDGGDFDDGTVGSITDGGTF